jgi:signal transduction histidine kinase
MEVGMYELVERILFAVSFIAIGGTLALIFFFVFAPSILGSRTINRQLEHVRQQAERMNEQLKQIVQHLENDKEKSKSKQ